MDETISTLRIEIGASSDEAVSNINKLSDALKNLKQAASGRISGFSKLAEELRKVADVAHSMEDSVGALAKASSALERLSNLKTITVPKTIGDGIRNIGLAAESITPESVSAIDSITKSLQRLSNVDLSELSKVRVPKMPQGGLVETAKPLSDNLQDLISNASQIEVLEAKLESLNIALQNAFQSGDMDKAYSIRGQILQTETALERAKEAADKTSDSFKRIGEASNKATKKVSALANTLNSLKRIAFYRAIRSAIKAVTQAFANGAENAYWYSKTIGDQTKYIANAYDSLSGASFTMSNQLGAAWATLKATITPILIEIVNLITSAASAITQFFAILGGKTTYLKAIDYSKEWADTTAKGAGAAKEWKNQLMGFDEINRLEEPSTGGGGSGSTKPTDYENMFEEAEVAPWIQNIKAKMDELKNSLNFEPLKSSWESLSKTVKRLGEDIVIALGWAWDNILVPLAHWNIEKNLPTQIELLDSALNLLLTVAEKLAPVFNRFWNETLMPLASWIGDEFLGALNDLTDMFDSLAKKVEEANTLSEFISSLDGKEKTFVAITMAVLALSIGFAALNIGKTVIGGLTKAIGFLVSPAGKALLALTLLSWGILNVIDGFHEFKEAGELTNEALGKIVKGIGAAVIAVGLFTSPWVILAGVIAVAVGAVIEHWDELVAWWENTTLYKSINQTWSDIKTAFSDAKTDLENDWENLKATFTDTKNNAVEFVVNVKNDAEKWWSDVKTWWGEKVSNVEEFKTNVKNNASDWWSNTKIWWKDKVGNVEEFLVNVKDDSADWWENVKLWWNGTKGMLFSEVGIINSAKQWWEDVKTWWNANVGTLWTTLSINLPKIKVGWEYDPLFGKIPYPVFSVIWGDDVSQYANGGFPEDGLFMANHGELVGQFNNGKTAVANNEQITEGISRAVYEAFVEAFTQTNSNSGSGQPVNIYLDGREIAKTTTAYQRQFARASG